MAIFLDCLISEKISLLPLSSQFLIYKPVNQSGEKLYSNLKDVEGQFKSDKLADPALLNALATVLITSLISAFLATLIYKFLKNIRSNKKEQLWVTFIFSFGTLFFIYSTGYFSRIISGAILFFSFYLLFLMKTRILKSSKKLLFSIGFLSTISLTIEYTSTPISGLLFLYLFSFFKDKKLIYYLVGCVIPLILLLSYHYYLFDNPFSSPYQYRLTSFDQNTGELAFPNLERVWGLSFSPEKGYFFFMPFMLLGIWGIVEGFRKNNIKFV